MSNAKPAPATRRLPAVLVTIAFLVLAGVTGWAYFQRLAAQPLSEDAVITAEIARIAPSVPGRVVQLNVKENGKVEKGELLFALDPEIYRLQVEQARAAVQVAEAGMDTRNRATSAEQSNAVIAAEQVQRARINLAQTTQPLKRLQSLLPQGYVTAQQVDDASTLKRNAETSLREALAQQAAAEALVGNNDAATALIVQSRAALAMAERQLRDTEVYAPNDGWVAGLSIAQGDYLLPAQSAFSLIDSTHWYASATFLETELDAIKPGDCATVYVAADRSRPLHGVVESIGWGVISEDLINLPRNLPYVPKALNWVRVGQRFPVRILLDSPPEDLMRVGASASVIVNHGKQC
ncbi:multidrug transporter subunit MdtN [Kerstersia gyiorum]|uniref:multidrug transporter subunit MdtN n=1 Tax=Kerstersia gyiorum TaxID=206506 RepID=UPI00209DB36C|nr:multidrug transporter subunit MdtN [Kerstersia gyiorum]MCP1677588.1 multidrug efflux system membrane fusion protein [Kerstersia gyiorum]MCP1822522.1 multidrug efflux system membrane fusion protein [Kerstersia gyiorum]MCP1825946.1 multidrug efflux system membrane fusion protein [Kerstersia gyiorum]MCW2449822.1 multidrug efflux system membrane fusion protein [Kerstersia gyiorum]